MALRPLELKYPPVADLSAASGGAEDARSLRAGSYIGFWAEALTEMPPFPSLPKSGPNPCARLLEGVRLYRAEPGSKLILSGGPMFGSISDSQVMSRVALIMGVNPQTSFRKTFPGILKRRPAS